jgi:hypothetical protein
VNPHDDRPRREPGRWFLNQVSDEVVRCVTVVQRQLDRELPTWATEEDRVLARLFVAHELMAGTWPSIKGKGVKTTSYKLAEAMDDVVQVLVDQTGRSADELSGRREIERHRARSRGG